MKRIYLTLILVLLLSSTGVAQDLPVLSLRIDTSSVQTGQSYDVSVRVDGIADLWLVDIELVFDPSLVYVIGTKAGSPFDAGALFHGGSAFEVRNQVGSDGRLVYTVSLLAPAEPIQGGGVIGTFQIYPLSSGNTQILFSQARLAKAIFAERDGTRVAEGSETLDFVPALLDLTISGPVVEPPSEATATPRPTFTPDPQLAFSDATEEVIEPTLVNITLAPEATIPPEIDVIATDPDDSQSTLLVIAVVFVIVGAAGGLGLFLYWRARYR